MVIATKFKHYTVISVAVLLAISCKNPPSPQPSRPDELMSYEALMETSAAARLNQRGDSAVDRGDYIKAMVYYQESLDSAAAEGDSTLYYDSKLDLAHAHFRMGEMDKAISIGELTVQAFLRSGDSVRIGRSYATLAGFYGRANQPEKSMDASIKGFEISKRYGSLIEQCAAYNQMAFVFSDAGNWAKARHYLDTALVLMNQSGILDQLSGIYLNLGDCHRHLENWTEASRYLSEAEMEATRMGQAHILAKTLERRSQVAESTGNVSEALRLYKKSVALKDSIFKADKISQIQELETSFEVKEKEQQILLMTSEKQAEAVRRNFAVVAGLLALALLSFGLYNAYKKLADAKQTLLQNKRDLDEFVALLRLKNAQIAQAEQAYGQSETVPGPDAPMADLPESEDHPPSNTEHLYDSRILTDLDWDLFKKRFESAFPGYLIKLRLKYPDLSNAEERFFLLIKLGFNTQEIADTLGITNNAVKKGRQRLRRRLGLQPHEDLEKIVLGPI